MHPVDDEKLATGNLRLLKNIPFDAVMKVLTFIVSVIGVELLGITLE